MPANKNVVTPDFGGVTDVTVIEVLVKPGDQIQVDSPIVTLESDKATMEIPSTEAGTVKEVKVKVGDKVNNGSVLVVVATEGQSEQKGEKKSEEKSARKVEKKPSAKAESAPKEEKRETPLAHEEPELVAEAEEETEEESEEESEEKPAPEVLTGTVQSDNDVHAGPGVRRLARELGVNLSLVPGSGPKQRILKEDVQTFVKSQLTQVRAGTPSLFPAAPAIDFSRFGNVDIQPLSRIKKIAGKNLQRNWVMIPHVTQFGEADITTLEEFRIEQKQSLEKQNVKLTPLVFVMKAAVASLKAFPHFNASLDVNGENLVLKNYYHIGVAVDTVDGLVVPVIRNVDQKGLVELAKELAQVSEKARKKQLTPQDMQGGSFSISSLGGIGGTAFTPIINAPEVAILGVSKANYKPIYQNDNFVPRLMLPLSLSYDHRVIDGADGARFMVHLTNMLSDIRNLLL